MSKQFVSYFISCCTDILELNMLFRLKHLYLIMFSSLLGFKSKFISIKHMFQ